MKRIGFLLVGALTATALADENSTIHGGRGFLQKVQAALEKVQVARYRVKLQASGWVAARAPSVEGTVLIGTPSKWDVDRFRCDLKVQQHGEDEPKDLSVGSDGDVHFLIDPEAKTAYVDMDPAVMGRRGRVAHFALVRELVVDNPFADEIENESQIELRGTESVDGVECRVVHIKPQRGPELTWYFGAEDHLPRRIMRTFANPRDPDAEKGVYLLTLSELTVNPRLDGDPFAPVVPEGFTRTDDFAP